MEPGKRAAPVFADRESNDNGGSGWTVKSKAGSTFIRTDGNNNGGHGFDLRGGPVNMHGGSSNGNGGDGVRYVDDEFEELEAFRREIFSSLGLLPESDPRQVARALQVLPSQTQGERVNWLRKTPGFLWRGAVDFAVIATAIAAIAVVPQAKPFVDHFLGPTPP